MTRLFSYGLMAFTIGITGCGDGTDPGQPVFPVSGTVTLFGAPLTDATVAFAPTAAGQPTAIGKTDKSGKFTLTTYEYGDGAAEGSYKVVINKSVGKGGEAEAAGASGHGDSYAGAGGHDAKQAGAGDDSVVMVPEAYGSSSTTTLTADVKSSGDNVFPFEIK